MAAAKGERPHGNGIQAFIKRGGKFYTKQFPTSSSPSQRKEWRDEIARAHRRNSRLPLSAAVTTFQDDAERYLAAVRQMPSYEDRERDILRWVAVFGGRSRADIRPDELAAQLHQWRARHAASTVNHRRTALMHLYTTLDGKHQVNPVRATPKFTEPEPEPRGLPMADCLAILKQMADSPERARLTLMLWTGWPQKQIMRLQPSDVNLEARTAYVRGRSKGKGVRGRVLPLTPEAVAALKAFNSWECWGDFDPRAIYKKFRRACGRLIKKDARRWAHLAHAKPYDFRHSFLTYVATATKDDRVVQVLAMHSRPDQTSRYTLGSVDPRLRDAVATLGNFRGTKGQQTAKLRHPKAKRKKKKPKKTGAPGRA